MAHYDAAFEPIQGTEYPPSPVRSEWERPALRRLAASGAQNTMGNGGDGENNKKS